MIVSLAMIVQHQVHKQLRNIRPHGVLQPLLQQRKQRQPQQQRPPQQAEQPCQSFRVINFKSVRIQMYFSAGSEHRLQEQSYENEQFWSIN